MTQRILLLFISGFLSLLPILGKAQASMEVKMDTNMLLIGDQTYLTLQVQHPANYTVEFPLFSDTVINTLEVLDVLPVDTLQAENLFTITHKYLVTSFDSGWYKIPELDFVFKQNQSAYPDTFQSQPVYFGVMTMPLDTVNTNVITDIKAPIEAPLTFKEILPLIGFGLGGLVALVLLYFLYLVLITKKPVPLLTKKEKPKEPAHIIALRDLDLLKDKKLWQQGGVKEFYIELIDIVRTYIEDRFEVPAMEMTTDEIIEAFGKNKAIDKDLKNNLFDLLMRADFIKFAKASALPDENEASMQFSYHFVVQTKPVVELREGAESEKEE
jgi:hypothetical protein